MEGSLKTFLHLRQVKVILQWKTISKIVFTMRPKQLADIARRREGRLAVVQVRQRKCSRKSNRKMRQGSDERRCRDDDGEAPSVRQPENKLLSAISVKYLNTTLIQNCAYG